MDTTDTAAPDVLVAGDVLVDLLPDHEGPPGEAGGYSPRFGGSGANVAMALERLGRPPLFWTRVAADGFGTFLRSQLDASDIPDTYLIADPDAKTTLAVVTHDADGERAFSFYREDGADTRLQPGTVPETVLESVEWVHTTGVTLSVEPSRTATLDLQARATAHDATVSLDPNWRPEMWPSAETYAAVVRGSLDAVDVVKGSRSDLRAAGFHATDDETLARSVAEQGPHTVLLTLGDEGALAYGTEASPVAGLTRHPGFDAEPVDTTGAGDAFLAGFIAAVTAGVTDPEQALRLANAAGAVATTQPGAIAALTGLDQIRTFVDAVPWLE